MKTILKYLKPYYRGMFLGFIIKVIGTFMDLGLPWVLAFIIDEIVPKNSVKLVLLWGCVMLVLAVGARQFNIIANQMAGRVAKNTVRTLRYDLFSKIEYLSGRQVDDFSIPSLVSRMTSDTYNIHNFVGMIQRIGVRAPLIVIGGIILTFTLEPVLSLVLVVLLPILSVIIYISSRRGIPLYMQAQEAVDVMVRTVRENISGIRVIKALSKTEYEQNRFAKDAERVSEKEKKASVTMALINPSMNFLLNMGITFVIILGAYRVNDGVSEVGKIVAFLSYFTLILNAILMLNRVFINSSKAISSGNRIGIILDAKEDLLVYNQEYYPNSPYGTRNFIEFSNVTFSYTKDKEGYNSKGKMEELLENGIEVEKNHVEHINFKIKKGEKLGIIGSTGSGKSTIINLLMRYYDIDSGAIYIEGKDIRTYKLKELREKFGVVFQNDTIFQGTLNFNIDFNREIAEDVLENGTRDAQAHEFISKLEYGMEHHSSTGGTNLSGGQKQRVLLSRALSGSPEILILDDSSSALDYKTDANLRQALNENYKDSTIIMVAQRISSIMHMEHILVLEEGNTIGAGSHEELLATCEVYNEIYQSQMGEVESIGGGV